MVVAYFCEPLLIASANGKPGLVPEEMSQTMLTNKKQGNCGFWASDKKKNKLLPNSPFTGKIFQVTKFCFGLYIVD
jgi:hypothetical protein